METQRDLQNCKAVEKLRSVRKAPLVIILVSLALLAAGIAMGEPARVFEQAVQVCLSCIGIG